MYKTLLTLVAVLAVVRGQATQVSQCTWTTGAPLPIYAEVKGCVTPPCQLPQLQDAVITMVFEAPKNMKSMRTKADISLTVGIFPAPPFEYNLQEDSYSCNYLLNSYCPVQKGEIIKYQLSMYIEPTFFVGVRATAEFQIRDEADLTPLACIKVPIAIIEAVEPTNKISNDVQLNTTLNKI